MSPNVWLRSLGPLALILVLVAASLAPTGGAADAVSQEKGRWLFLEEGPLWEPAEPPAVTHLPPADLGAYHNYDEAVAVYQAIAAERPDLFTLTSVGSSVDGRTIWMMSVTGPGDATGRARVLFDGAHHGNEVIGSEILVRFLKQIHAEYDDDPVMQAVLADVVIDVVPMVNVDSNMRIPQCSHYAMCRKNSNGVDLNRNYADNWGGTGSSGSPGADTYRGPSPLSEPETQAVAALLDAHDYALHASLHSGIELILWPHGWTSERPPDLAVYEEFGDELTAITGVTHGQISRALYFASGTTVDQAYGSAAGWRAISYTPEVHGGPGNAFDWWLYFNPPETESAVSAKVGQWLPFLWHFAVEAPKFAPPVLDTASLLAFGPGTGLLSASVAAPERRPLLDASLRLDRRDAPIFRDTTAPVPLGAGGGDVDFDLIAYGGGDHAAELVLDAGPAGVLRSGVDLEILQLSLDVGVADAVMGSPHRNTATATVAAGPFESVSGELSFAVVPGGRGVAGIPFEASPGSPAVVAVDFGALGLEDGPHRVIATAQFTAMLDGAPRSGLARLDAAFTVVRPQVELDKSFPAESAALESFTVRSVYRNAGSLPALDVVAAEVVPPGYLLEPLTSPTPDGVVAQADGSTRVSWRLGELAPGGEARVSYRVTPLAAGETPLSSQWRYGGDFDGEPFLYAGDAAPVHRAT